MKSRRIVAAAVTAAFGLLLAGCSPGGAEGSSEAGSAGTIKIAPVLTSTGALAENAQAVRQAWDYAVEEVNAAGGVGGYDFEVLEVDTDATPASSVRAASQAINQDGAKVVLFQTSPENAAISTQLESLDALSINGIAQDDGLREASCSPNAFYFAQSNSMMFNALEPQLDEMPGDKWAVLAVDYSLGHGAAEAFGPAAEKLGKEVVSTQFFPLNTVDFGSYITEIQRSGADSLLVVGWGADAEAFVNQAAQYDLKSQIETTLTQHVITPASLGSLGDELADDYLTMLYDPAGDNELNADFVEGYEEAYGELPNDYAANTYLSAQGLFAAVERAGSDDVAAIRDALSGLTFDSIVGEVTMRADDHQALTPIHLARVVEGESGLEREVLSTVAGEDLAPEPSPECTM